jgi:hypothetical protein
MITHISTYSELASTKAYKEARAFYWLELAEQQMQLFEQTNRRAHLLVAQRYIESAEICYLRAEYAHQLMCSYWNS